jgi:hypothetical protein
MPYCDLVKGAIESLVVFILSDFIMINSLKNKGTKIGKNRKSKGGVGEILKN